VIIPRKLARRYTTYHNEVAAFTLNDGRICPCCDINDSLLPTNKIVGDSVTEISKLVNHRKLVKGVHFVTD
jgi:hypothetical protein